MLRPAGESATLIRGLRSDAATHRPIVPRVGRDAVGAVRQKTAASVGPQCAENPTRRRLFGILNCEVALWHCGVRGCAVVPKTRRRNPEKERFWDEHFVAPGEWVRKLL